MANYATLKAAVEAVITQNGNNEITGNILQQTLLSIINSVGFGYQFVGIATPATNPGTPDQNVFYIASTAGTYTNFSGLVLDDGEIAILKYNGAWSKDSTGAASAAQLNQLGREVDGGKYIWDGFDLNDLDQFYKNYSAGGGTRGCYMLSFIPENYPDFNIEIKVAANSTIKASATFKPAPLSINTFNYTTGWVGAGETYSGTKSNIGSSLNNSYYLWLQFTYISGGTGIPTISEIKQYVTITMSYVIGYGSGLINDMSRIVKDQIEPIADGIVFPISGAQKHMFIPCVMEPGKTYNIHVDYNGYAPSPASNYALILSANTAEDTSANVGSIVYMSVMEFAGTSYDLSFLARANSSYLRVTTTNASSIGTGIEISVKTKENILDQYIPVKTKNTETADFKITDSEGNAIVEFKNGHIKTKNFNSEEIADEPWERLEMGDFFPSFSNILNIELNNSLTELQKADFAGFTNGTLSDDGFVLTAGLNPLCYKKIVAFDDEKMQLRVSASATDKILFYATYNNDGTLDTRQNCSYALFDFVSGRISIYQAETVNTTTGAGTELVGEDFVVDGEDYIIEIGRYRRQIYAAIYNITTAESNKVLAEEALYPNVNVGKRPAGWLYYFPAFMTLAGTPKYKRLSISTRSDLYMLFQGDSFTQGYNVLYDETWTYMAARKFGNSMGAAISGSRLTHIIQQYHDSIKGKVNTKIIVISEGINDMLNGVTTDEQIASWAATFKNYVDELVADGIIPIINRIWPEGSTNETYASVGEKMNNYIRSWGFDGADFGNVVGYNTGAAYYSNTHLNPAGNVNTYKRFVNELSKYKIH